jgi:molybdopterin converting factor small subunit
VASPAEARHDSSVPTVRYFAAARAAAGVSEEVVPATTLGSLRAALVEAHGEGLASVLRVASFLVDGLPCRDPDAPLPDAGTVDVLPPFAGG